MKSLYITFAFALFTNIMIAQPSKGNPGGSPTPFGFTEVLIGAGLLYGGKKAYDKRKEDQG